MAVGMGFYKGTVGCLCTQEENGESNPVNRESHNGDSIGMVGTVREPLRKVGLWRLVDALRTASLIS